MTLVFHQHQDELHARQPGEQILRLSFHYKAKAHRTAIGLQHTF